MNTNKKQLVSMLLACAFIQAGFAESLSLNNQTAPVTMQMAPAMQVSAPVMQVKPQQPSSPSQPLNSAPSAVPSVNTAIMAPKAQISPAPVMSEKPVKAVGGFAPTVSKPPVFAPKPSVPVMGTDTMHPDNQIKPAPVMQPVKPRGFAPVVPVAPKAPAFTAKSPSSLSAPGNTPISSMGTVKMAPEHQMPAPPSFQQKQPKVKQMNGFAPIGSFAQQNKDGRCQPLKDIWHCKKPEFIKVYQRKKQLADGRSVVTIQLTFDNGKEISVWLDNGSNKRLFHTNRASNGGRVTTDIPVSLALNNNFKDGTPIRLELTNPYGKAVSRLKLVNNPLDASGLNLPGKNDVAIPKGGFGTASSMPGTSKTLKKVSQKKLLEPRIFKFSVNRGTKGKDNSYLIGENTPYTLDYQVRFADEIVFKHDGGVLWRKKGLDPNEIISDSIKVDSIAGRTFNDANLKKSDDYTLEVIRHSGFVVKKAQQSIKVVYSAAKFSDPVIKKLDAKISRTLSVDVDEKGYSHTIHLVQVRAVFQNAKKLEVFTRSADDQRLKPLKLEGQWSRMSPKMGHEQVFYKQLRVPESPAGSLYVLVSIEGENGKKVSKDIEIRSDGNRIKTASGGAPGSRFSVGYPDGAVYEMGKRAELYVSYHNVKQYEIFFTDNKSCKVKLAGRKYAKNWISGEFRHKLYFTPSTMKNCKAIDGVFYGEIMVTYKGIDGDKRYVTSTNNGYRIYSLEQLKKMGKADEPTLAYFNISKTPVELGGKLRIHLKGYGARYMEVIFEDAFMKKTRVVYQKGQGKDGFVSLNKSFTMDKFYNRVIVHLYKDKNTKIEKVIDNVVYKTLKISIPYRVLSKVTTPSYARISQYIGAQCEVWDGKLTHRVKLDSFGDFLPKNLGKGQAVNGSITGTVKIHGMSKDLNAIKIRCDVAAYTDGAMDSQVSKIQKVKEKTLSFSKLKATNTVTLPSVKLEITSNRR